MFKIKKKFPSKKKLNSAQFKKILDDLGLSKREVDKLYAKFSNHLSSNTDGKLSQSEFIEFYSELRPDISNQQDLCNFVFRMFDGNGDGSISFHEFIICYVLTNRGLKFFSFPFL